MEINYSGIDFDVEYRGDNAEPDNGYPGSFDLVSVVLSNVYDINDDRQRINHVDIVDLLSKKQTEEILDLVNDVLEDRRVAAYAENQAAAEHLDEQINGRR